MANFTEYGAIGNGIADDTQALRNAFNAIGITNLEANAGSTFRITGQITINRSGNHVVNWNNSTILANYSGTVFYIDKTDGSRVTMSNAVIDCNDTAAIGCNIRSAVTFVNVDVNDVYAQQGQGAGLGFTVRVTSQMTSDSLFDNCNVYNVDCYNNTILGDSQGATRNFSINWDYAPDPPITITFKNATLYGSWGEDGDVIEHRDNLFGSTGVDIGATNNLLIFENVIVEEWSRRGVKGYGGATHFRGCIFNAPDNTNPRLNNNLGPAGMITIGHVVSPTGFSQNVIYEGCTFNAAARESRVIPGRATNCAIRNCTFNNGADLMFYQRPGYYEVCSNTFNAGSTISDYAPLTGAAITPDIRIGTNNTFVEANPITLDDFDFSIVPNLVCPPLNSSVPKFSDYGAVGNGITDDTAAIQAALNAEANLEGDLGATYLVTGTLNLNQSFAHTINWNNTTITTNTQNVIFFNIDKRTSNGGDTYMENLHINANDFGLKGVVVYSRSHLVNITGQDYRQFSNSSSSPSHINANFNSNVTSTWGDWIFDGCDVDGLWGYGNYCDYCDGTGAANGYLVFWNATPSSPTTITFKNASSLNGFGVDGQNVGVFSPGRDVSNSARTIFDNITTKGFNRRGWKLFCGGITVKNCLIQDNPITWGFVTCGTDGRTQAIANGCDTVDGDNRIGTTTLSAGLFTLGKGSGATGSSNNLVENTTFVGEISNSRDKRFILIDTTNVSINNCTFQQGADLAFTSSIGNINICGCTFQSGSTLYDYNESSSTGTIRLGTNNIYADGFAAATAGLTFYPFIQDVNLTCNTTSPDITSPVISNIIISNITSKSFRVSWNVNEPSTGRIEYGLYSGVYTESTTLETNYLTFHSQPVGANNDISLKSSTKYYFRIKATDSAGNIGYSSEQSITTLLGLNNQRPLNFSGNKLNRAYIGSTKLK